MNSRNKGKRGERLWRDELRANGYDARRGQQFSGSSESPDVVCDALPWLHFEVKCVERLNIEDAMEQARRDCGTRNAECGAGSTSSDLRPPSPQSGEGRIPIVAHKRNHRAWLVTMDAETFFRFLRGDIPETTSPPPSPQRGEGEEISTAACAAVISENNKPKETNEDPS